MCIQRSDIYLIDACQYVSGRNHSNDTFDMTNPGILPLDELVRLT